MTKAKRYPRVISASACVATLAVAVCGAASAAAAQTSSKSTFTSTAEVLNTVAAAAHVNSLPSHLTPPLQDAASDDSASLLDAANCNPATNATTTGKCVFGDPNGSKTIVLLGDSHAGMWWSGFNAVAKQAHWKLVLLMKAACPAVDLNFWNWQTNTPYPACNTWHQNITARINKLDPAVVVVSNWWHGDGIFPNGYPPTAAQWQTGLEQTLNSITSPGTKKVVWGDIAYLAQTGADCLAAHESDVQACSTPASQAIPPGHEQTLRAAAQAAGATYVSTTPWLCSTTCTAVIGKYGVYADANHISASYAHYLAGAIQAALKPVMG